jgi:hypothetical protein
MAPFADSTGGGRTVVAAGIVGDARAIRTLLLADATVPGFDAPAVVAHPLAGTAHILTGARPVVADFLLVTALGLTETKAVITAPGAGTALAGVRTRAIRAARMPVVAHSGRRLRRLLVMLGLALALAL